MQSPRLRMRAGTILGAPKREPLRATRRTAVRSYLEGDTVGVRPPTVKVSCSAGFECL